MMTAPTCASPSSNPEHPFKKEGAQAGAGNNREMRVIESFSAGKHGNPVLCEDVIYAGDDFIAVIDGVTDKDGLAYNGMSGGRWAALTVANVLEALPAESTLGEAERRITATLAAGQRVLQPDPGPEALAGAVMVCYSRARRELWRIGDCHFAVDEVVSHGSLKLGEIMLAARWAYLSCLRQAGFSDEEIAADPDDPINLLQHTYHHFSNIDTDHPLAYGVLNGHSVPERLREIVPVGAAHEIALASDGYPVLLPTLKESENYLAADLAADPLRIGRHRSFNTVTAGSGLISYDDRAYVRFVI